MDTETLQMLTSWILLISSFGIFITMLISSIEDFNKNEVNAIPLYFGTLLSIVGLFCLYFFFGFSKELVVPVFMFVFVLLIEKSKPLLDKFTDKYKEIETLMGDGDKYMVFNAYSFFMFSFAFKTSQLPSIINGNYFLILLAILGILIGIIKTKLVYKIEMKEIMNNIEIPLFPSIFISSIILFFIGK